ncbi:MAG TPA: hypothetical protein VF789_03525 [Thermoanaerobaculia bacterium]
MKIQKLAVVAAVVLIGLAGVSSAQTRLTVTDGREAEDLKAQGWKQVEKGLWQRTSPDGRKETFVSGTEGLEKALPLLRQQEARLMEAFLAKPTEANKRALDQQSQLVDAVAANLRSSQARASQTKTLVYPVDPEPVEGGGGCTRTFSYGADVRSFHCIDVADSSASYSTNNPTVCPEQCTVYTYSYISSTCGGTLYEDIKTCSKTGTNVSCSSWAQGSFAAPCYDYAFASIHCPQLNNLYLSQSDYTTSCFDFCCY